MFRRVFLDNWMSIFPLIAFITAAVVYVGITYKALRMCRAQVDRFAHLPFNDSPERSHDSEV